MHVFFNDARIAVKFEVNCKRRTDSLLSARAFDISTFRVSNNSATEVKYCKIRSYPFRPDHSLSLKLLSENIVRLVLYCQSVRHARNFKYFRADHFLYDISQILRENMTLLMTIIAFGGHISVSKNNRTNNNEDI